jgi:hypothetical protein
MLRNKIMKQSLRPENISVIVCGYPAANALDVAKACCKRGYKLNQLGLAMDDNKSSTIDVPECGKVNLVNVSNAEAKSKLQTAINEAKGQGLFPVVADTTNAEKNVTMYNELQIPFVLQSAGGESHVKAIKDTEASKTFALIAEDMNKSMAAFDAMWGDWAKRFPGLLTDFDFNSKSTAPERTPRSLFSSFSDLFNRNIEQKNVENLSAADAKKMGMIEGSSTRTYNFKNGSGTSTFTFSHSTKSPEAYAEGVADAVGFLARKANEMNDRPRVFNILDVAEQGRLMW